METVEVTLGHGWQQLTDGTVNATLQFTGAAGVVLSPDMPGDDAAVLRIVNRELSVPVPSVVWGRALWYDDAAKVVIARTSPGSVPPLTDSPTGDAPVVTPPPAPLKNPEYYYVIPVAGQSNMMAYGEGVPLPDTL
ncbi:hypothetical protein HAZ28_005022, partial [Salmonella enterica]|nr:hypothetical protein [Salmonella enterica]